MHCAVYDALTAVGRIYTNIYAQSSQCEKSTVSIVDLIRFLKISDVCNTMHTCVFIYPFLCIVHCMFFPLFIFNNFFQTDCVVKYYFSPLAIIFIIYSTSFLFFIAAQFRFSFEKIFFVFFFCKFEFFYFLNNCRNVLTIISFTLYFTNWLGYRYRLVQSSPFCFYSDKIKIR